jgi:hypothetical protein
MRVNRERDARGGAGERRRTLALLASYRGSLGQPWQNRAAARDFVRQVTALAAHFAPGQAVVDDQRLLGLRTWALWCLSELGDSPAQTVRLAEEHVSDCERLLGASHPDTLTSRSYLASAYSIAGQADQAVSLHEGLAADCERLLGAAHPAALSSCNNLASAYWRPGRSPGRCRSSSGCSPTGCACSANCIPTPFLVTERCWASPGGRPRTVFGRLVGRAPPSARRGLPPPRGGRR